MAETTEKKSANTDATRKWQRCKSMTGEEGSNRVIAIRQENGAAKKAPLQKWIAEMKNGSDANKSANALGFAIHMQKLAQSCTNLVRNETRINADTTD